MVIRKVLIKKYGFIQSNYHNLRSSLNRDFIMVVGMSKNLGANAQGYKKNILIL